MMSKIKTEKYYKIQKNFGDDAWGTLTIAYTSEEAASVLLELAKNSGYVSHYKILLVEETEVYNTKGL
jgi:oxalate decarboxylase/phosphoglucose isomerase-like protein (cupin superfamily)